MCCRGGACCVCVSGGRAGSSPGCGELAGRHPRRGAQYGKIPIIARIEGSTPAAGRSGRRQVDFIPGEKFNAACRRVRGGAAVHQASRTSFSSIQRHIAQRWAISGTKAGRIPGGNDSLGGRRQSAVHAGGPSRLRRTWTYLNYDPELRWRCSKARRREERRASGGAARPDDGPVERSDPSSTRRRPVVDPSKEATLCTLSEDDGDWTPHTTTLVQLPLQRDSTAGTATVACRDDDRIRSLPSAQWWMSGACWMLRDPGVRAVRRC